MIRLKGIRALMVMVGAILLVALVAPTADAHRPPLSTAKAAAKKKAEEFCWQKFPLRDGDEDRSGEKRCNRARVDRTPERGRGHTHRSGAWIFQDNSVWNHRGEWWSMRLSVTYVCAENRRDGLPCVEYNTYVTRERGPFYDPPPAHISSEGFSQDNVRKIGR